MNKRRAWVYLVTCLINGKQYVGFTNKTPEQRFKRHIGDVHVAALLLHEAIKEFGVENFTLETIFVGTYKQALRKEKSFIEKLNTKAPAGYNRYVGGSVGFLGKRHSFETKKKLMGIGAGRRHTPVTLAKMSVSQKGHPVSEKTRAKIRAARTGLKLSLETKAKVSASLIGNTRTKGYKHTEETKLKMSVSAKRSWAKRKKK